jgi:hypothetical protein
MNCQQFIEKIKKEYFATEIYNYLLASKLISSRINKYDYLHNISMDIGAENYLKKIMPLENDINEIEKSYFYETLSNNDILTIGLVIFVCLFIIRHTFYGIKWSFKQLYN